MPILLQQGLEGLFENLGNLVYLVLIIGAAILPMVKKYREEQAKSAQGEVRRSAPDPESHTQDPAAPAKRARGKTMEERLRRYLDDLKEAQKKPTQSPEPEETTPTPGPFSPPSAAPTLSQHRSFSSRSSTADLSDPDHDGRVADSFKEMTRLEHMDLPSEFDDVDRSSRRQPVQSGKARGQRAVALRRVLRRKDGLRQAFLLKEILNTPKGLEDL